MGIKESTLKGCVTHVGTWKDKLIYRYVSIDRFLEIIENEENTLAHISKWEDPNEAYLIKARIVEGKRNGDDEGVRKWYDLYRAFYGQSWMFNGKESDVLWRAYGKRGETVRIATTVKGLGRTFENLIANCSTGLTLNAFIGAISYVDEMRCEIPNEDESLVRTLFVKRNEFLDENEFRVVVKVEDKDDPIDKSQSWIRTSGGLLKYRVAISDLIQSVLVDPCCTLGRLDEIRCRVMNAGLDMDIKKSSLFNWPSSNHPSTGNTKNVGQATIPDSNSCNAPCEVAVSSQSEETKFWTMFQATYHNGKSEFSGKEPPDRRFWGVPVCNGLYYYVTLNRDCARAELYIDSPSKDWNKALYERVRNGLLDRYCWASDNDGLLPDKRASRIAIVNHNFKFSDREKWNDAIKWLCDALDEVREATKEYIEPF